MYWILLLLTPNWILNQYTHLVIAKKFSSLFDEAVARGEALSVNNDDPYWYRELRNLELMLSFNQGVLDQTKVVMYK